ncbi:hypothetical protein PAMP_005132 [Pampus punctatissimus]
MGWWGIVLIQQASTVETELPFWRNGAGYFLSSGRDVMVHGEAVWAWWCWGKDPTVLRVWGFHICKCIKIPVGGVMSVRKSDVQKFQSFVEDFVSGDQSHAAHPPVSVACIDSGLFTSNGTLAAELKPRGPMVVATAALFLIIKPLQWTLRVTGQPQARSACAESPPLSVTAEATSGPQRPRLHPQTLSDHRE